MSSTLTDRYVQEVVRRIPADQREDVAAELRATIADTVQARIAAEPNEAAEAGPNGTARTAEATGAAEAERAVLLEMGDPIRLAASYADRPVALIGPKLYPVYARLIRMLLTLVLPIVVLVMVALDVLRNNDVGSAFGTGIAALITTGAQLFAWPTVIFAFLDRVTHNDEKFDSTPEPWSPDDLPPLREPDSDRTDVCAGLVWNVVLLGLLFWQQAASPYRPEGEAVPFLDPALWTGWIWPVVLGIVGLIAVYLVRLGARRWTGPLVGLLAAAHLLVALPLAWIVQQHMILNPEFLSALDDGVRWTVPDAFYTVTVLVVLVIAAWDIVVHVRKLRRR